ncbi:transmembrane 4 L6 family member 5 [Amia ocellicauda]|uniref:transmembrane 4 L6 family member 5 n=1 Tax=Amia ocellicauda TaxID=2972642 RepID=UPI003463C5EC
MCTGKCAKCIGGSLYPFALVCIICNIILFFPDWSTQYTTEDTLDGSSRITEEVKYMGGLIGGGILVLVPAIHIQATGKQGCCANRCGMFLSIAFAAVGLVGGLYSLVTASLGLINGPTCLYMNWNTFKMEWGTPFAEQLEKFDNSSYLFNKDSWSLCKEPENVVEFNITLFSIIMAASCIEMVLCAFQIVNGLFGCLCGTCGDKGPVVD